ncbi:MAG: peptidase C11 [Lachnospiraceae bacterium]|nr:peptidase C11 [Lachnospiraceae bacterium]
MDQNGGRQKRVTEGGKGVSRRGSGLGTGSVGNGAMNGRNPGSRDGGSGAGGGGMKFIILLIALLLGGGGGSIAFLGGGSSEPATQTTQEAVSQTGQGQEQAGDQSSQSQAPSLLGMLSGFSGGTQTASTSWKDGTSNTGKLDRTVASGAREKRTQIKGNGTDTVTIMVYLCGTDLESRSGMASNDIAEMCKANLSDKVNILLYTGGCKGWKTDGISNSTNQIYQVTKGGLKRLVDDDGEKKMTDPDTLSYFIKWCSENYPADRNELIFWDHGGGSLSGYGYDEKFATAGSMNLAGIDKALKNGGVTFDFIGFDACLMATLETALTLDPYADYMIASEETEPGIGWYYTDWLSELSANTSMDTIEIGQKICDDFVSTCALRCQGQKTTLSVIDLSEISQTVPEKLSTFAENTGEMIRSDGFQDVSNARAGCREFAVSSKIDQIDLVNFAQNLGTNEAGALTDALLSAVKYNRTSSNMTNAYGVSIYFPYKRAGKVNQALNTYQSIGLSEEYGKCIQSFAGMETGGQLAGGGAGSPLDALMGLGGSAGSSGQTTGSDAIGALLGAFLSGGRSMPGVESEAADFMQDSTVFDPEQASDYIAANSFDDSLLVWEQDDQGRHLLALPDEQWDKIQTLLVNMYYDDGEGYVDLGLDNLYEFEDGKLVGDTDNTWLSIDNQPVAFYYESTVKDGDDEVITGYVPVLINSKRANLILVFDKENPYGYIAGARYDYKGHETDTVAKSLTELTEGDKIEFVADYYSYNGSYRDTYVIGDAWSYHENAMISNTDVQGKTVITYLLTDFYNRQHYAPAIEQ